MKNKVRNFLISLAMAITVIAAVMPGVGIAKGLIDRDDQDINGFWKVWKQWTYYATSPFVFEGATLNAFQTTIAITDPTADRTITLPDAAGAPILSTAGVPSTASAIWGASNQIIFEGATADAYETTVTPTDPTADRTITLPDDTGTVILSSLAANAIDYTNGVWGASNGVVFEGSTANTSETTITATNPTADRTVTLPDGGGTVMLSSLATNATDAANSVTGASNGLVYEGTANDFETTLSATDPTADRAVVVPDAAGTVMLSSLATNGADAANAVTGASNGLVFEGATANGFETTVSPTDPTADNTITLPDSTGSVMLSAVSGYATDYTTAVWQASDGSLAFEGATADAFETSVSVTDPTADRSIVIPNAAGTVMLSSLATNGADAANAVTGASNGLVYEGATANDFETTVSPTDPTADRTVTLPDDTGTVMLSSLAANAIDYTNAVWGASNGVVLEGATANGFETTVSATDPTADRTVTVPDESGDVPLVLNEYADAAAATYTAINTTTDGPSLSIADAWFTSPKKIRFSFCGTVSGANAGKQVLLYIDNAAIVQLDIAAATTGDFSGEFVMAATGSATQVAWGHLQTAVAADGDSDFATDTTDFSDGGATTVKMQIVSANIGDNITLRYVFTELLP